MRPCTQLISLLLLNLSFSGSSRELIRENCSEDILVRRDQFITGQQGCSLELMCAVTFCSDYEPFVLWTKYLAEPNKLKLENRWVNHLNNSGVSYLVFRHLLLNDSGEYRCETNYTKGHFINLTVTEDAEISKNDTSPEQPQLDKLQPYLYAGSAIVLCVIVVIFLSLLSMQQCSGTSKTTPEYQHTVMPMTHHPPAHPDLGQAPPIETALTISAIHHPSGRDPQGLPSLVHNTSQTGCLYSNRGEREEAGDSEVDQSVWYAALNHDLTSVGLNRRRSGDCGQSTEYAAIRVPESARTVFSASVGKPTS